MISPNLAEKILELSCQNLTVRWLKLFRVNKPNNKPSGVWDVIQTAGQRQKKAEYEEIKAYKNHQLNGMKFTCSFEEADGVWLSMQVSRKREMVVELIGIAYEDGQGTHLRRI